MPATNSPDTNRQTSNDVEGEVERRTRALTLEQKRILAAKLYDMLRDEMRIERERLAVPHRLF